MLRATEWATKCRGIGAGVYDAEEVGSSICRDVGTWGHFVACTHFACEGSCRFATTRSLLGKWREQVFVAEF